MSERSRSDDAVQALDVTAVHGFTGRLSEWELERLNYVVYATDCNFDDVVEQVRAFLAEAWDRGARSVCPDPDRCWCDGGFTHTPHHPRDPNPYREGDR